MLNNTQDKRILTSNINFQNNYSSPSEFNRNLNNNQRNCMYNTNNSLFQNNVDNLGNEREEIIIRNNQCVNILKNIYNELNLVNKVLNPEKKN